jgi:hypothetical protein
MKNSEVENDLALRHSSTYGIKEITPQKNPARQETNNVPTEFESFRNNLQRIRIEMNDDMEMLPERSIKTFGIYILTMIFLPISLPIIVFNKLRYHPVSNLKEIEVSDQLTDFEIFKEDIELLRLEIIKNNAKLPGKVVKTVGLCTLLTITFPLSLPMIILYKIVYAV